MNHFKINCLNTVFVLFFYLSSSASANVIDYFNTIKADPNALYAFFKRMPKGGELHYHLAGGAYPETMLALVREGQYCINPKTLSVDKLTQRCHDDASRITTHAKLYNNTLRAWSMKDFIPGQESGHDHFFASFFKFIPLVRGYTAALLADTMQRAANQHELYMEIIISPDIQRLSHFESLIKNTTGWKEKKRLLLSNKPFQQNITQSVSHTSQLLTDARKILGCDTHSQKEVCRLTIKFQYEVHREQPINPVFVEALFSFAAASQSNDIVAVNLVQAEDGPISLRDYHMHMALFKFLHHTWSSVHVALHAGELTPKVTTEENLQFHIHAAIFTGQAERIGHGSDIAYENNAKDLLHLMATRPVPVEISLTSNDKILNLKGKTHPINYYLANYVPVVLSTDDEGILRTDLTQQYVNAVINQGLDYPTLKAINRNALTFSFLPGKSIWLDPVKQIILPACQNLFTKACEQAVKGSTKAMLQFALEKKLYQFEGQYSQQVLISHIRQPKIPASTKN